jgi:hypothetical protein
MLFFKNSFQTCKTVLWLLVGLWACNEEKVQSKLATDSTAISEASQVYPISSCQPCHAEICDTYEKTGKGKALSKPDTSNLPERFPSDIVHDRFKNLSYLARWKNNTINMLEFRLHGKDTLHKLDYDVAYVIGSGNQTRSYLREVNGYLYEMPLTWYSAKKHWDLSPGYEKGSNSRFSRPIGNECLGCHNSFEQYVPESVNKFVGIGQGIGCDKCHGDPSRHLKLMQSEKQEKESGLVNLKTLPLQAQIDVCRQCHLEGIKVPVANKNGDYEPGKLLSSYYHIFIPHVVGSEQFGFASHAERLQQSACFKGSAGKLNCVTCHDPHTSNPGIEVFVAKCQSCHGEGHEQVCVVPVEKRNAAGNNCVSCHMRQSGTTDIPHVSSHDHFIRKNPGKSKTEEKGPVELVSFTESKTSGRDLGLAYLAYFETQSLDSTYLEKVGTFIQEMEPEAQLKYFYLAGKPAPETLLQLASSDPYTLFYQASLCADERRLKWYSDIHGLASYNLDLRFQVAQRQFSEGQEKEAINTYQQLYELNPDNPKMLVNLGFYLLNHDLKRAMTMLQRAVQLDPDYVLARENWVKACLLAGNNLEALQQLEMLILQNPGEKRYAMLKSELVGGIKN